MKKVRAVGWFFILLVPRLCIPVSFLIALILSPVLMLSQVIAWPAMLMDMWDDPI